jgi:hypothetical protein
MLKKLQVLAVLLCMLSYSAAGTVSIGTASARGDMRVDSYMVKGNATLFDGSVVETGQASADLRLAKGTEITMAVSSRGTLYSDRLVLQQGQSELAANSSFQLQANGLRVTPSEPHSRGVVSMKSSNTVEVAALTGSFGVTNDHGVLLASVRPGRTVSFAMQAAAGPLSFYGVGMVSYENGNYYLTIATDEKFLLTGQDFSKYVGKKMQVTGTVQAGTTTAGGAAQVVTVSSLAINGAVGGISTTALIIGGVVVAGGVGLAVGVYEATKATPAASL